jgi:signal transduction histidine kinase
MSDDDRKSMELLENALQGAQRGKTLTQRMLAFARHQELKQEIIDIPDLVRGMKDLVQRSLGPSHIIETRPRRSPGGRRDYRGRSGRRHRRRSPERTEAGLLRLPYRD